MSNSALDRPHAMSLAVPSDQKQQSLFLSLPDELILEIVKHLPVLCILQVERTCKTFLRICCKRSLWLHLLSDLNVECTPNIPPNLPLSALSDTALRNKIVSAVTTRNKWGKPEVNRMHDVRVASMPVTQSREDAFFFVTPRMLPSGAGVFVVSNGVLTLLPLSSDAEKWVVEGSSATSICMSFNFEVLSDGRTCRLACVDIERDHLWRQMGETVCLRVISFDLVTHEHQLVFKCNLHDVYEPAIILRGSLILLPVQADDLSQCSSLIIDWEMHRHVQFRYVSSSDVVVRAATTTVVDDHVLAFIDVDQVGFAAVQIATSYFEDLWSEDFENVGRNHIVHLCPSLQHQYVKILPLPSPENKDPTFSLATSVFTPSWTPGMPTSVTAVFMAEYTDGLPNLISYHLQHTKSEPTSPLKLVKWNAQPSTFVPWNSNSLTHSALMFELVQTLCCFNVLSSWPSPCCCNTEEQCACHNGRTEQDTTIELALRPDALPELSPVELVRFSVEPWSGNLVVLENQMLYLVTFDASDSPF